MGVFVPAAAAAAAAAVVVFDIFGSVVMALPLPMLERLSVLLTMVGGSGISSKCKSSSLKILQWKNAQENNIQMRIQNKDEQFFFDTNILRLTDKLEHDAGRRMVLAAVLCTQPLYFLMIAFKRSFSNELYASKRMILNERKQNGQYH